jgi:hypothetical protein
LPDARIEIEIDGVRPLWQVVAPSTPTAASAVTSTEMVDVDPRDHPSRRQFAREGDVERVLKRGGGCWRDGRCDAARTGDNVLIGTATAPMRPPST